MLVLVVYDINTKYKYGEKRLLKIGQKCHSYGRRVQNSTYECIVDQREYVKKKKEILYIIEDEVDSLRFYNLGKNYRTKVEVYGLDNGIDVDDNLIF